MSQKLEKWLKDCEIKDAEIIGDHFLGKYRVMYGYRLRAGKLFSGACDIDLCCGDNKVAYDCAYRIYKKKMEINLANGEPLTGGLISITEVKPYWKDSHFGKWLTNIAEELYGYEK